MSTDGRNSSNTVDSIAPLANDGHHGFGVWVRSVGVSATRSRWLMGATLAGAALVASTWVGIRTLPWFGPMLADGMRAVVGAENVTKLEEVVAHVEDRVQAATSGGTVRSLSDSTPPELLIAAPLATPATPSVSDNRPPDAQALYPRVASPEDGVWQAVPVRGANGPVLYRTMLHPDAQRAYSELFVFALDMTQLKVQAVAGSIEPKSEAPQPGVLRPGLVPEADREKLVAAFNGGFKAEHGKFGMMVAGNELLAPRPKSCTFAEQKDGTLAIATWTAISAEPELFSWWRQTPACMLENGALHPGLQTEDSKNWGATLEGKTVIRRSAVGLGADGRTLYVGISNSTTARALALGMKQVGATNVAQLDVNHSFPRFLLYTAGPSGLTAQGAVKGLLYQKDEFLGRPSTRDFFYVTLR
jgi:Phosphodiester glycosidase